MDSKRVPDRKLKYGEKLKLLLAEYPKCLVVTVDNVGSKQISEMRKELRGQARFLFGKNTIIRKVLRNYIKESGNMKLKSLMELCQGNSGFCFLKGDIPEMRNTIISRKRQSAARAGSIAPDDVWVRAGPTGMEPTQTSFFQTMDIPTRINRGQIDIVNDVKIIRKGEKVGASQASLCTKLNIRPFYYGMNVSFIYDDGTAYDANVLDITQDDLANSFMNGLRQVSALCKTINYPTILTVPHDVLNAYKKVLGLGLTLDGKYTWDGLKLVQEVLANPGAFVAAAGAGGKADDAGGGAAAPPEPEPESSSSDSAAGPGLFGGDSDSSDDSDSE